MKRILRKIVSVMLVVCMGFSFSVTTNAEEVDKTISQPVKIGEYDGWLSDCLVGEDIMLTSVSNVRINSYATYDRNNGIKVVVKLYVPAFESPQPEFTSMTGTVSVLLNNRTSHTAFSKAAARTSTIQKTVNTRRTGQSGDHGTISVSGAATATNALAGGGAFAISYPVTIP